MKKFLELALGIITSIGGFLEAGSIATAAQAGALYSYQLLWSIAIGTLIVIFLIEMSGRLAAISHHPLPSAVRERFGFKYYVMPLVAETLVDLLVLAAEIGGCCVALQLLTGFHFVFFAIPVALLLLLLLWNGTFGVIEYGVSTLGLITIIFAVAAFKMHPNWQQAARGLAPTLPHQKPAQYGFLVVSIIGATISPYLFNFYSSGAVEDEWDESHLWPNRITATLGMGFGGLLSMAVLIASACVLAPQHIAVDSYDKIAKIVTEPLGQPGYYLFAAALFIACFGAALELSLDIAYVYAQTFGWTWGENKKPRDATRFVMTFTGFILAATVLVLCGLDPLKLTIFSMAITTLVLPLVVLPFLVLMNDKQLLDSHTNSRLSNILVLLCIVLAFLLALAAIPLQIMGGT